MVFQWIADLDFHLSIADVFKEGKTFTKAVNADALDMSKKECKMMDKVFNAGRGSFSYKKRLGFTPEPMYALVNTSEWQKKYNHDLSIEETLKLYGRDFYSMRLENEK